jgi:large subunit ribosomal protein L9
MQVILKQDIPKVGHRFDVVTVSNGYANNFLFPQKLAEPAEPHKVAQLEKMKEKAKAEEQAKMEKIKNKLDEIKDTNIEITEKSDEQGHLYKKVNSKDIVKAVENTFSIQLPETAVLLDAPITEIGDHEVDIEAADKKVTVIVKIAREK